MNLNRNLIRTLLPLALVALVALGACTPELDLGDFGPESPGPLAENTTTVWLFGPVNAASSSATEVVDVTIDDEGRAILHAGHAGTATVNVDIRGESHDVAMEVRPVAERLIQALPGGGFGLPHTVRSEGVALLPGAALQLRVLLRDAAGERLTGDTPITWSSSGAEVTLAEQDQYVLVTAGAELGVFDLVAEGAEPVELEIVSQDRVARVSVHNGNGELDQPILLENQQSPTCHLAAWIDDGRYLQGAGDTPLEITSSNPAVTVVIATNDFVPPPAGKQFTADVRGFRVEAAEPEASTLELTWSGMTASIDVVVP